MPSTVNVKQSATLTRPADTNAYASADLLANSTTAGSVTPLQFHISQDWGGGMTITKARLRKSGTGTTNASFRLHLFSASPTVTNGDNGVFLPNQAATWLGSLDVSASDMRAFSDGAAGNGVPTVGNTISLQAGARTIYGLTEVRGAYTPASAETFDWTLEALKD